MDQKKTGYFLSQCRREKNMTQAQLAELLGVSNRSVSRWENGITLPDVSLFVPLCQALDMTLDEFFAGERQNGAEAPSVSARHMEGYARYLARRTHRRTAVLALLLALALLLTAALAALCSNRTFFTGRYESESLATLEPYSDGNEIHWYDAAQDITILHYFANNDGIGFVNTVYITYHAGRIPGA